MFNSRSQGVSTPEGQGNPRNEGPENTVINASRVEFVAVEYFDAHGRRHQDVLFQMGDDLYKPHDSEGWAHALRGVAPWLSKGIKSKMAAPAARIPAQDAVSVVDEVKVTAKPAESS